MNRLVREHYPVSKLPEDLREGFEAGASVRVTVDVKPDTADTRPSAVTPEATGKPGLFSQYKHLRRENFKTNAEVDAHVAALRDEWSDRER